VRYQYRYTKDEKRWLAAANRVLDDPTAPPREVNKALQHIQRIQDAAEGRAFDVAVAPTAPSEPTVDALVRELEAKKQLQGTDSEALGPAVAPTSPSNVPEVTPNTLEAVLAIADGKTPPAVLSEPTCRACGVVGQWNTFWPIGTQCGPFCPPCFGKLCAADMARSQAAARARAEQPLDWETDFAVKRNVYSSDFQKSQAIWAELDRENADRQEQERIERDRVEARKRADLADRLSGNFGWRDGGKL
jgi:hypothetical protein